MALECRNHTRGDPCRLETWRHSGERQPSTAKECLSVVRMHTLPPGLPLVKTRSPVHKRQGGHMSIGTGSEPGGCQPLRQHELGRRASSLVAVCLSLRGKQKVRQVPVCCRGHLEFRGERGVGGTYHCRLSRKLSEGSLTGAQASRRGSLASSYGGSLRRSAEASRGRDLQIRWLGWGRIVGGR